MANLTRYTAKFYKDASKIFYAVFTSASENPITDVEETSKSYSYSTETELLSDGAYRHTLNFPITTSGKGDVFFTIRFQDGSEVTATGQIPTDKQILVSPHDSLSFSTVFSDFNAESKTYDVADSIYYRKSPYKTLYIYPSSILDHLDTSSTEDFYYTTAGSAAYIASNDLQNSFLIANEYSAKDIPQNQLGKFIAGRGRQVLNFSQYTTKDKTGPVVYGYVYVNTTRIPEGGNTFSVSKNKASSNYYLRGCKDLKLPCVGDGTTFSNDCITGVALTASDLNKPDNIFNDGGCGASCDGFELRIAISRPPSTTTATDGVIFAEVVRGTPNYTWVLTALELEVGVTYGPTTVSGSSSDTQEFTGIPQGTYSLKITDSATSACILTERFRVRAVADPSTTKGCTLSGAVNYDSGVTSANALDHLCVFCNSSTGLLTRGTDHADVERSLGVFAKAKIDSVSNASSSKDGPNSDGRIIISALQLQSYRLSADGKKDVLGSVFNVADHFKGGTDFEYKLYSLRRPAGTNEINAAFLAANGSVVATQSNANGAAMSFGSLAAKHYVVQIYYTKDGATEEYEDCFITLQFSIAQLGCTDPDATNFLANAQIDDGSCHYPDEEHCGLGNSLAILNLACRTPGVLITGQSGVDVGLNLFEYDSNYAGATQFVNDANISPPANVPTSPGQLANPANCFYAVEITYLGGNVEILQGPTLTFYNLILNGFAQSLLCGNRPYLSLKLMFSYGGALMQQNWQENAYLNQGNCNYEQYVPINQDYLAAITRDCCDSINPGGGDDDGDDDGGTIDVYGCTDREACNYNPDATIDDNSCEYVSCETLGCTDPTATNFNPEATLDDGSCDYNTDVYGCTDPNAVNWNTAATVDDGSCSYVTDLCQTLTDFLGHYQNPNYPPIYFATATESTPVYNSSTEMCEDSNSGTITLTLPNTQILAYANPVDAVYWVGGMYNTNTGQMYLSFIDQVYQMPQGSFNLNEMFEFMNSSIATPFLSDEIPEGFVTETDILTISQSHTFSNMPSGNYIVIFQMYTADNLNPLGTSIVNLAEFCVRHIVPVQVSLGECSGQPAIVYGCTDMQADNYNPSATDDDGTCTYPLGGCTDVYAINYNPNALADDGSCEYAPPACSPPTPQSCGPNIYIPTGSEEGMDTITSCCIPKNINTRLEAIEECLAASGSRFYNKMITGLSDTCSTMDAWKMVIILEILRQKGLPCVYNCSDNLTPDLQNTTCAGVWAEQGSNIWYSANTYQSGHVVQSPVDLQYYVAINNVGLDTPPTVPVTDLTVSVSGWRRCCDEATYSGNVNYLTKFLSFVEKYCKDCEIPPYNKDNKLPPTEVDDNYTAGGLNIENNGASFGDS